MHAIALEDATTTVLVPKNRGLAEQVRRALVHFSDEPFAGDAVRGEDVAYIANEIARSGRGVLAFSGDDLVDEWLAAGNKLDPRIRRERIMWSDPGALYGAPALCLIGSAEESFFGGAAIRRIAVCSRYRNLARRFLAQWANASFAYEIVEISGAVETVLLKGVADFMIDVVVTGRTIAQAGLRVHRVISTSDLAVLQWSP
ncbi:MAG TPA: hypothetical protein VGI19_19500 [Candidatus Cybelea sp.]|jgi:ATP phosphoribosyltransferase